MPDGPNPLVAGVRRDAPSNPRCVIIGAGPAGLTAAHALIGRGVRSTVLEADDVVGGIARTVERNGCRFDIGGHRFYTKVPRIERLWRDMLPAEHWLTRPRRSRIHFDGKLFEYPLEPGNVLRNLGPVEALRCIGSYGWARVRPPRDQTNFEGWVAARFGWRLYRMFFETYTRKVWGTDPSQIGADWAAQRIKDLSLKRAVLDALTPRRVRRTPVTSLITEFQYPKHGPGMLWDACRRQIEAAGAEIVTGATVTAIVRADGIGASSVRTVRRDGTAIDVAAEHVISSMPLGHLIECMEPPAPAEVRAAASALRHRDFLTVVLVVPDSAAFPDNWIYIHSPQVAVGRIQNFGAWSPYMVTGTTTCLGLEYFVNEGDALWSASDEDLVDLATTELDLLGLVPRTFVETGYVVRMPKAYPVYDHGFQANVDTVRRWLDAEVPNVHPVGRNGMHRYNNQDHSMMTALLAVENILDGAGNDVWAVNVEDDHLEVDRAEQRGPTSRDVAPGRHGSGRDAPILPGRPDGPRVEVDLVR